MVITVAAVPFVPIASALLRDAKLEPDAAALAATTIPAAIIGIIEWIEHRRRSRAERVEEALRGDFYRNPWVVCLYVVIGLQVFQALVGFFVGVGVGAALSVYAVPEPVARDIALTTDVYLLIPSAGAFLLLASRSAAHRLASHRYAWLSFSVVLNLGLNVAISAALLGPESLRFTRDAAAFVAIANALYFGAVALGVWLAGRSHDTYRIARAYRQLDPEDRRALLELSLAEVSRTTELLEPPAR